MELEVIQRGASNVRFGRVSSAIDIPPESNYDQFSGLTIAVTSSPEYKIVSGAPDGPAAPFLVEALAGSLGVEVDQVWSIVRAEAGQGRRTGTASRDSTDVQGAEWRAFMTPQLEGDDRNRFVTRRVELPSEPLVGADAVLGPVADVVQATRLREVRALTGFTRLKHGNTVVAPDLGRGLDWLPAIEVFGEGLLVSLSSEKLSAWEKGPALERAEILERRRAELEVFGWLPTATPRFVLLHTFAHLLIRQLAFESGYPSASLIERIYARTDAENDETGVLIYTAAGDQEGTLGGLVRQGEPDRLVGSLLAMLERASWCGTDPICRESRGQGIHALNLAACHACTLISETSCVYSNALLDRTMIAGSPEPGVSLFADPLRLALSGLPNRDTT